MGAVDALWAGGFARHGENKVGTGVKELMFQAGARLDSAFPNPFSMSGVP